LKNTIFVLIIKLKTMAAISSIALSAAVAGYQVYNAEQQKSEAKKAIESFESQDTPNPFENVGISTRGAEMQTEAAQSGFATSVDALQRGGTRAVASVLPRLSENNILLQGQIAADIDRQAKERDMMIARGDENIRQMRENREQLALQGLGQQLQVGRQDSAGGMMNLVSGMLAGRTALNQQSQPAYDPFSSLNFNEVAGATVERTSNFNNPNTPFSYNNASIFDNTFNPFV
jgi:hypothetical protein